MKVNFKIRRFDITKNNVPYWQTYGLDVNKRDPILTCLDRIKDDVDGTLTYRENCRNAICGSCAMRINGKAALACKQHVEEELHADQPIIIEPMGNMSVLKDLVVDMIPFWNALETTNPWLMAKQAPEKEFLQPPHERDLLKEVEKCIMCGACFSDCQARSVNDQFLGPAALAKAYRYLADTRDNAYTARLKEYNKQHAAWDCTHCFQCNEVCPVGVKPMTQILKIQRHAMAEYAHTRGAKHHLGMVDIIKKSGWLDENKLAIKSVFPEPIGLLSLLPIGWRMMRANKLPPLLHKPLKCIDEIRSIERAIQAEFNEDTHGEKGTDF